MEGQVYGLNSALTDYLTFADSHVREAGPPDEMIVRRPCYLTTPDLAVVCIDEAMTV